MIDITVKIQDARLLKALGEIRGNLEGENRSGPIGICFRQWSALYFGLQKRRFDTLSRGGTSYDGAHWEPLAESTILSRRSGKGGTRATRITKINSQIRNLQQRVGTKIRRLPKIRSEERREALITRIAVDTGNIKKRRAEAQRLSSMAGITMLRDTGTLFAVLDPGVNPPGKLDEAIRGGIKVGYGGSGLHPGTSLTVGDLAEIHHYGTKTMPARKVLAPPDDTTLQRMSDLLYGAVRKVFEG